MQSTSLVSSLLDGARKRRRTNRDTTTTVPTITRPPVISRAMAAVLQSQGVSVLELMRRFVASNSERSMLGLTAMANEVRLVPISIAVQHMHSLPAFTCTLPSPRSPPA
jgi:hypothetical protein